MLWAMAQAETPVRGAWWGRAGADSVVVTARRVAAARPPSRLARVSTLAVMGLDLGNHTTRAAVLVDGVPAPVVDRQGRALHASMVALLDGEAVVGNDARAIRATNPASTVVRIRQMLGRAFYSSTIKHLSSQVDFEVVEGPDHQAYAKVEGREYSPEDLAAQLISHVRGLAEQQTGEPITGVMASVHAHAEEAQRAALRRALSAAGFEQVDLVEEPAAVLAACELPVKAGEHVVIFEISGHALQVAVLENTPDGPREMAHAKDPHLGGNDFDERVQQWLMDTLVAQFNADPAILGEAAGYLRMTAEEAKNGLALSDTVAIALPPVVIDVNGHRVNAQLDLTVRTFDHMCMDMLQRMFKIVDEAVAGAGLTSSQVDHLVFVGGPTRLPLIRKGVARYFKKDVLDSADPNLVVALGALLRGIGGAAQTVAPAPAETPETVGAQVVANASSLSPPPAGNADGLRAELRAHAHALDGMCAKVQAQANALADLLASPSAAGHGNAEQAVDQIGNKLAALADLRASLQLLDELVPLAAATAERRGEISGVLRRLTDHREAVAKGLV